MKTGMKVKSSLNGEEKEYTIVVAGDINGDGKVTTQDMLIMKKTIIALNKLTGAYYEAADLDGDGHIRVKDMLRLKKIIIGL